MAVTLGPILRPDHAVVPRIGPSCRALLGARHPARMVAGCLSGNHAAAAASSAAGPRHPDAMIGTDPQETGTLRLDTFDQLYFCGGTAVRW